MKKFFLSASHSQKYCTSKLESRSAHETSVQQENQNHDNLIESSEQGALKVDGDLAVTFSPNFDADYPYDFDAGMDLIGFNSHLVSLCYNTSSQ